LLPSYFTIASINIGTLPLFVATSILVVAFLFWRGGVRAGYPEEKILDLTLVVLVSSLVVGRIASIILNQDYNFSLNNLLFGKVSALGGLFGAGGSSIYYIKRRGWSIYTIGDIASVPLIAMQFISSLGRYLVGDETRVLIEAIFYLVLFGVFYLLKKKKFFAGFYIFLYLISFSLIRIFSAIATKDLRIMLFASYSLLIIFSVLALGRRVRKVKLSLLTLGIKDLIPMISKDIVERAKGFLTKKREKIEQEKLVLESEDPYMEPARAEHNAELADDAQEDREHDELEAQKELLGKSKKQVDKALEKIEKGTYGACDNCGKEIDPARLEALPEATTCVNCESQT